MKECAFWRNLNHMVGRDTPEPIRLGRPCKTSHVKAVIVNQESPCFSCGECQRARLSSALSAVRQKRRTAKDTAEIMKPVLEWKEKNRAALKSLETILGTVRTLEKDKDNRFYVKRTDIVQRTLQEHEKNGKGGAT